MGFNSAFKGLRRAGVLSWGVERIITEADYVDKSSVELRYGGGLPPLSTSSKRVV